MTFSHLQEAAVAFADMVNEDLSRAAIQPMTLEIPEPPPDELHFTRLVVWCYGFFYEAAADVLKECQAMLSTRAPDQTNLYGRSARVVQTLRTYKVHNLPPSQGNTKKRQAAEAWIAEATADGRGVAGAIENLCGITQAMLSAVTLAWEESTRDPVDRAQLIERLVNSLEKTWQPHQFDEIVRDVAEELELKGLNVTNFRTIHSEAWRSSARCFVDRETATIGLRRIIRKAMENHFGSTC